MRGILYVLAVSAFVITVAGFAAPASAELVNVVILHTGDTEGHLMPFIADNPGLALEGRLPKPSGGVAKRQMFVSTKRQNKKLNWLLLDCGGAFGGTPLSNLYQGYADIEMMKLLKYDAMGLGESEFGFGQQVLKDRIAQAGFPMLCANAKYADSGKLVAKPYEIIDRGGFRIAVIGLIGMNAADHINAHLIENIVFDDPVETAKSLVAELKGKADAIVALTYQGVSADIDLAVKVPELNIVIGGMSDTELEVPMRVADTLIVHAGKWGSKVGMLKVTFEGDKTAGYKIRYFDESLVPMDGKIVDNTNVLKKLAELQKQLDAKLGVVVGEFTAEFSNVRVRASESELGNFVADISKEFAGTDCAFLSAATIRAALPKGPVTVGDIYKAFPEDHVLVVYELAGKDLERLLDQGASKVGGPGFPQVSGITFGIYGGQAYEGTVGGVNIVPDEKYTVVTTDYLANGGDDYGVFQDFTPITYTGVTVRDVVEAYIRQHTNVTSALDGRIYFLTEAPAISEVTPPVEETAPPAEEQLAEGATDAGSGGAVPPAAEGAPIPEGGTVNLEDAGAAPVDEGQPPMVDERLLGYAELADGDLSYAFAVIPREADGKRFYEMRLVVENKGATSRLFSFQTRQRVEFTVKDGDRVAWNWAARRYWPTDADSMTLVPGDSVVFSEYWDGLENSGVEAAKKLYRFEGQLLCTGGKAVGFTSLLEWETEGVTPAAGTETPVEEAAPAEPPAEGESGQGSGSGGDGQSGKEGEGGGGQQGWF